MSQPAVPLEHRNVPVCFPNSHLLQTNRVKGSIWHQRVIERVGELGSTTGAARPGLSCVPMSNISVHEVVLGFAVVMELARFRRVTKKFFSLEVILFPYHISCISLLSLSFTRILTYKPMFVLLSSFSLPTYFPSEIMR